MKLGFFTMPMHPAGRDYTQTLKEDREAVLLADRLGYCEAFIGEHIGTLLYCGHDWAEPRLARRSMELMAEKVMPAVNAAIGPASRAA